MKNCLRNGSVVTLLRSYATDSRFDGSPHIARGACVTILGMRRTTFGCRAYDVTDGVVTLNGIPRHALGPRGGVL